MGAAVPTPDTLLPRLIVPAVTLNTPLYACAAGGANPTVIWQLVLAASTAPQFDDWLNPVGALMTRPDSALLPGLVRVKICVTAGAPTVSAPKFAAAGNKLGAAVGGGGGTATPTPDTLLLRFVVPAVTASRPLYACAAVGAKVSVIWQLPFAASAMPQFDTWVNPGGAMMVKPVSALVPGLLNVKTCGVLLVPTVTEPKFALAGNKLGVATGGGGGAAVPRPDTLLLRLVEAAVTLSEPP